MAKENALGVKIKKACNLRKAGIALLATSIIWTIGGFVVASEREANSAKSTMNQLLETKVLGEFQQYLYTKYAALNTDFFDNKISREEYSQGLERLEDPMLFFDYARESDDVEAQEIMARMDESTEKSVDIINGGLTGSFLQFLAGLGFAVGGTMRKKDLLEKSKKYPNSRFNQNNDFGKNL